MHNVRLPQWWHTVKTHIEHIGPWHMGPWRMPQFLHAKRAPSLLHGRFHPFNGHQMIGVVTSRHALREMYSARHTLLVLAAIILSTTLLYISLQLPIMDIQKGILWKRWRNSYSVWAGVVDLWEQQETGLSLLVFFFSIIFPFAKLLALTTLWLLKLREPQRQGVLHWLGVLGKWSMLDVFIVAILIMLVRLGPLVNVEPRTGVYVFAAAIAASMLTTMYVDHLARRSHRPRPSALIAPTQLSS
jgi:paraquat-inducible protein A